MENKLKNKELKLIARDGTTMALGYQPEVDSSLELDQEFITTFQELIGILQWADEIRRVDILTEISMLSSHQASPREWNLGKIYYVFSFLKNNPKSTLYFDPREPLIDLSWFQGDSVEKFKDQYQDSEEQLTPS